MYEKIEKLYREKSVNNIIFRKSCSFYIVTLSILCLSGIYQKFLYIMPFYIIMVIYGFKKMSEKILKQNLFLTFNKKNTEDLATIINRRDVKLMKKYIIDNQLDNNVCLQNIIDHYRNLCSNQHTLLDFGFWITCAISVVAPFLEASGINATLAIEAIKRLLIVFFYVGIFYWIFKHFFITVQSLYGNYNINKNLEKIFSDIFLEMNKTKFAKESKNFNKRKKLRKQILKLKV